MDRQTPVLNFDREVVRLNLSLCVIPLILSTEFN